MQASKKGGKVDKTKAATKAVQKAVTKAIQKPASKKVAPKSAPRKPPTKAPLKTVKKTPDARKKALNSNTKRKRLSKKELKSVIEDLKKDPNLIVVRKALKYVPIYLKSEGLTKKLLKEIIKLWADSTEKIRVICLLCLIRVYTKLHDSERKQLIIKKLYTTFLDKCRITKYETMSMIGFMRHSLVELFKLDSRIAFKQAQASCQQLSMTLKNATTHKNEESYKSVLNWQFANCLILLSQLITSHDHSSPVRSLTQQVIQLNIGAINLLMSPRYYPFYCHLIENLIHISISSNLFIPILPLIVCVLRRISIPLNKGTKTKSFQQNGKSKKDSEDEVEFEEEKPVKEYNINLLNHVSLDESHTHEYNLAVLDKLYEITLLYLASQCHKIAFPELVFLPCVHIRKWLKFNPGIETHKFKVLMEKIKADCNKLEEARKDVDFAFSNYSAVDAWEKKMRDSNQLSLPKILEQHNQQTSE